MLSDLVSDAQNTGRQRLKPENTQINLEKKEDRMTVKNYSEIERVFWNGTPGEK